MGTFSTKEGRHAAYQWALKQKGKGSISKIGAAMKKASNIGGTGAKLVIKGLGKIGDLKAAYAAGAKAASGGGRKRRSKKVSRTYTKSKNLKSGLTLRY